MTDEVRCIDLNFLGVPGSVAAHLLPTADGLALVDTGPATTLPTLQAELGKLGVSLADIRHILLTHIHFDHAGAAGVLAAQNPDLRVYVHARGARHLASPERLVASATQIYGGEMERLWGQILPVSAEQLVVLEDGESVLGGVQAFYTPGHAVHHLAYLAGSDLFVGDVGGIRLDARQSPRAPTPPPDIDLGAWRASIALLRGLEADTLRLPHFGAYPQEAAHWDALERNLEADALRVATLSAQYPTQSEVIAAYTQALNTELDAEGGGLAERFDAACPPFMNVQGLQLYFKRKAEGR